MRALILKEIREGWNVVLFGGGLFLLMMGFYVFGPLLFGDDTTGLDIADGVLVILPPLLATVAASALFAREHAKGTLPLLLALPLSRTRIWAAKVVAGLVLALLASLLLLVPAGLVLFGTVGEVTFPLYAREIAMWWLTGFALAALCSTLAERPFNALLVGLLDLIGLFVGAIYLVSGLGGSLFGFDPFFDISFWALLTAPPFLLASLLTWQRGELLFRRRKWTIALPTVALTFALLFALTVGVTRVATRYQRSEVNEFGAASLASGTPVIALTTAGQPVTPTDLARYRGGGVGEIRYRSRNLVFVDIRTGKEVLVQRVTQQDDPQVSVSRDGRYAAVIAGPAPLIWGDRGESGLKSLTVWDLRDKRVLYHGLPQYAVSAHEITSDYSQGYLGNQSWSPDGSWLAVTAGVDWGKPSALIAMRPDGGGIAGARLSGRFSYPSYDRPYAWDPSGKSLYFLDENANLVRWTLPDGSKKTVWRSGGAPEKTSWDTGEVSVSPGGEWIAVTLRSVAKESIKGQGRLPVPAGQVVSWRVMVAATDGSGATAVWEQSGGEERAAPGYEARRFAWSADGTRLYFAVWSEGEKATVMCWPVGEAKAKPVVGATDLWGLRLVGVPTQGDLLLSARRVGIGKRLLLAVEHGHAREVKNEALYNALGEGESLGLDADGRAVLYSYDRPSLSTLDLSTGDLKQIYP